MAKAEPKTRPTSQSVEEFLNSVSDTRQREDAFRVMEIFERVTGEAPVMWGSAIVGFGRCTLKYASGRELDWPITGFSPRKGNLTLYVIDGSERQHDLLSRLGPHKTGKVCLYIKRLSEVDENVLEELIADSVRHVDGKAE